MLREWKAGWAACPFKDNTMEKSHQDAFGSLKPRNQTTEEGGARLSSSSIFSDVNGRGQVLQFVLSPETLSEPVRLECMADQVGPPDLINPRVPQENAADIVHQNLFRFLVHADPFFPDVRHGL